MASKTPLADVLAKELGYKSAKELKTRLRDAGGGDFGSGVLSRLESGAGFGESFKGGIEDKKRQLEQSLELKTIGKKVYRGAFSGNNLFSAYMRGRLNKKKTSANEPEGTEPTPESGAGGDFSELNTYLRIIAKSALSLHLMARDVNVFRQNIVKLVKLESKKNNDDRQQAVNKADAFFLREDEREAKLESERSRLKPTAVTVEGKEKEEESGGLLDTILGFFNKGILGAIKSLFNPANLLKVIGKIFVIATIFASLFQGITAGFERWKETGSLKEAIFAGLGGIVDFLTFGLFGEDNIRKMYDSVMNFMEPIIQSISDVITDIKDWVANNIGIPKIELGTIKIPKLVSKAFDLKPEYSLGSIGPYYPFKDNPKSDAPQKSNKPSIKLDRAGPAPEKKQDQSKTSEVDTSAIKEETGIDIEKEAKTLQRNMQEMSPELQKQLPKDAEEAQKLVVTEASKILGVPLPDPSKRPSADSTGSERLDVILKNQVEKILEDKRPKGSSGGATPVGTISAEGGGTPSVGSSTPSSEAAAPPMSGSDIAASSSEVAEAQRLESSADIGSIINAQTFNNSSGNIGKETTPPIADVYDTEFAKLLAA
jgi:hypothetical protein